MAVLLPETAPQPLTLLTEEEQMFRETVRQFAQDAIASRVARMDEDARTEEIARMLAGASVTEEARAAAARLLSGGG